MRQENQHITQSIKSTYKKRMIAPLLYLVVLFVLFFLLPIKDLILPQKMSPQDSLSQMYRQRDVYVNMHAHTLYFTGYTSTRFGQTTGYYYYTIRNKECILVQLSPSSSEEGLPIIHYQNVYGKIIKGGAGYDQLLTNLSKDLKWTKDGISKEISPYIVSEAGIRGLRTGLFLGLYFLSGLYALIVVILSITYLLFPILSPTCIQLGHFGKAKELLAQAEEELATLPQLATEDMFITETFFIEISGFGVAIVPIKEIIWVYKHSTLHKFLWYHFVISSTLHITGNKHFYIQCPKNIKSDIDGVIDYLSEANHDILVGFNEANRLKVQAIQHRGLHFEKIIAILKKHI
ncbi:MAG: DUF6709 family protein [Lachnospiraceae bacterium]